LQRQEWSSAAGTNSSCVWSRPRNLCIPSDRSAPPSARESTALWVWGDTYYETELLMREIIEQAKEEEFFAWGL
jgi:hypothetical protein